MNTNLDQSTDSDFSAYETHIHIKKIKKELSHGGIRFSENFVTLI